jgi:hypothetical protein
MCSQQDIAEEEFEATKGRQSESVYRRRTDNTMAKRKCTKTIFQLYHGSNTLYLEKMMMMTMSALY